MALLEEIKNEGLDVLRIIWELISAYRKEVIVAALLLVFFLEAGKAAKAAIFIPALIALGAVSMIYNREIKISLGIELVMLATVLCSAAYGPITGAAVGFITLLLAELIGGRINEKTVISFIGIIVAGLAANGFVSMGIATAGIITTLIYDAIIIPLYLLIGSNPGKTMLFLITHIVWNAIIFMRIAPLIYRMMV